jgi:hypothetical protein
MYLKVIAGAVLLRLERTVTFDVKTKVLRQLCGRCTNNVCTETLNRWENLLADVPLYVRE